MSFIFLSKKNSRRKIFSWLDQTYFEMFREKFKRKLVFWKFFLTSFSQWLKTFWPSFRRTSVCFSKPHYTCPVNRFWKFESVFFSNFELKELQILAKKLAHFSKLLSNCPRELFLFKKMLFRHFRTFLWPSDFEWNVLSLFAETRRQHGQNIFLRVQKRFWKEKHEKFIKF